MTNSRKRQEELEERAGIVLVCPQDGQSSDFREDLWEAALDGARHIRVAGGTDWEETWLLVSTAPLSDEDAAEWLRLELASLEQAEDDEEEDAP